MANQSARKTLFTVSVYTKANYTNDKVSSAKYGNRNLNVQTVHSSEERISVHVPQRKLTAWSLNLSGNLLVLWGLKFLDGSGAAPTFSCRSGHSPLSSSPAVDSGTVGW